MAEPEVADLLQEIGHMLHVMVSPLFLPPVCFPPSPSPFFVFCYSTAFFY